MAISSRGSLESGRAGQGEQASPVPDPASGFSSGSVTPPQHADVAFVAPAAAPLVVVYLAAKLALEMNGSAQSNRARIAQLQNELLAELRRVPGMTATHYESIRSALRKAVKGGATAFAGFASWLKSELMGLTSGQRPTPSSSAPPTSATRLPRRAASPAAAPAVEHAVAKAQRLYASTLGEAKGLNQAVAQQMRGAQSVWNAAQKQMAQFYWQSAGGQAATPRLQEMLVQLQDSIQELRKAHAHSNEPLAMLKSRQRDLTALERDAVRNGLAPTPRGALGQVDNWVRSAEQWRTDLNQRIHALEQWAREARAAVQAGAAAGAQGAALMLALPPPPAAVAPSVVQAARAAERALQQQPARLPELGSGSTIAVPSGPGAPGARVWHSSGVGTREQVEERRLNQVAEELQRVEQQIARSRRTQLPGASPEDQAQRERGFYNISQLAQMGVTYTQLQDYLQRPQGPAGTEGAAVRAGMGGGSGSGANGAGASVRGGGLAGSGSSGEVAEPFGVAPSAIHQLLASLPDVPEDLSVSPQDAEKMKLFVLRLLFNAFNDKWPTGFAERLAVRYDAGPAQWWNELLTRNLPQSQEVVDKILKFFPDDVITNLYRNLEKYLSANDNALSSGEALATRNDPNSRAALFAGLGPQMYEEYGDGLRLILSEQIVDGLLANNPFFEDLIKSSDLFRRISFLTKDALINSPLFRRSKSLKPKALVRMLTNGRVDDHFPEFDWFLQALAAGSIKAESASEANTEFRPSDSRIERPAASWNPWVNPDANYWRSIDDWTGKALRSLTESGAGLFENAEQLDHAGRQRLVAAILRRIADADAPAQIAPGGDAR